MKFFLTVFSISLILFLTIHFRPNKNLVDLPSLTDFKHNENKEYRIGQTLMIQIKHCLANVEMDAIDGEYLKIEYAYNDPIRVQMVDDRLEIESLTHSTFCQNKEEINAFVKISIPKHLIQLSIQINAYFTRLNGSSLSVNLLHYQCNEGDITLKNSKIKELTIDIFKGTIELSHILSDQIEIYNSIGMIQLKNNEIYDIMKLKLNKGDIVLNQIKTRMINSELTFGDTKMLDIEAKHLSIKNDYGNIELDNTYSPITYLSLIRGDIHYYNEDHLFFIDLIEYSLEEGNTNFDLYGNIIKV